MLYSCDNMPKIQDSKGRYSITIPKDIAKLKGWKKGTVLEFVESGGSVCLVEVRHTDYEDKHEI